MKIVHVVPRLQPGGATRSTIDVARAVSALAPVENTIVVLGASDAQTSESARSAGIPVIPKEDPAARAQALDSADIVHLAFWNTPELYAWLATRLPPARLVVTFHTAGEFPAQVITAPLLAFADWIVATTPHSLTLPVFKAELSNRAERITVILDTTTMPDANLPRPPHIGTRVGYAGTVDFVKMHPRFIEFCAAANLDDATFAVAGGGTASRTLQRQAEQLGIASQFEWHGYLQDVQPFLASCDIFGYPLCRDTYATSELIVQEAMSLGVPPVVLPYGGLPTLVTHNETGIVASEDDYPHALAELARDNALRTRLGTNARLHARHFFGADKSARRLLQVYENAMTFEKRERTWHDSPADPRFPGASALITAFGEHGAKYRATIAAANATSTHQADAAVARVSPVESSVGGGGILDYRRAYPDDAMLRLWSGLVLAEQGHFALAAVDFHAAKQLGLGERASVYLDRTLSHKPLFEPDTTIS